jgi:hypothetical protein
MSAPPPISNSGQPFSPISASDIQGDGTVQGLYSAIDAAENKAAEQGQQLGDGLAGFDLVHYIGMESTKALDSIQNQLRMSAMQKAQGG